MNAMVQRPIWERDGADWPLREASRFVRAAGLTWHVQELGQGPAVLLLHGTGASTHSWRGVAPRLAERFKVIALDLPGHAFTQAPPREFLSLFGMALAVNALLREMGATPALVVGHSAGAAIAARMSLDGHIAPHAIIGVNAALLPLHGLAGHVFSPLARLFARLPFVSRAFARHALDRAMVEGMIADTGSRLDRKGIDLYWRLAQQPSHIAAAFGMMAEWDLPRLERDLPRLPVPLVLVTGSNDRSIAPSQAERVGAILPRTQRASLRGLGHLAHEERPDLVCEVVLDVATRCGVFGKDG